MVLGVSPESALLKAPVPAPLTLKEFAIVGPEALFQQTPRAVTALAPASVIVPPEAALVLVIDDMAVVVKVAVKAKETL